MLASRLVHESLVPVLAGLCHLDPHFPIFPPLPQLMPVESYLRSSRRFRYCSASFQHLLILEHAMISFNQWHCSAALRFYSLWLDRVSHSEEAALPTSTVLLSSINHPVTGLIRIRMAGGAIT